jgi:arylformamidase
MYNLSNIRRIGRDYRKSELDTGYDQGVLVADPSPWLDVWRKGTERARRRTAEVRVDIAYGNSESERFDLYLPNHQPRKLPFVAFVHGGEWQQTMRADSGYPAKAIHHRGAAFVAIGYDAVPAVDLDSQVDQVRRAWRYLVENAARFGLDPTRGHLVGHCSGAHLAALAAFDPLGTPPLSAVLLSGIYDLEPMRLSARNEYLRLTPETAARLSPIRSISRVGPTVLVAWGAREPEEFRRQSRDFARACKSRGLRTIQGELPGRNHFDTSLELADPHSQVLTTLRA